MVQINGTIALNGVTDKQMETIWSFKAKHGSALVFAPNAIQVHNAPQGTVYNNVLFSYNSLAGINLVTQVVNTLHSTEQQHQMAA